MGFLFAGMVIFLSMIAFLCCLGSSGSKPVALLFAAIIIAVVWLFVSSHGVVVGMTELSVGGAAAAFPILLLVGVLWLVTLPFRKR